MILEIFFMTQYITYTMFCRDQHYRSSSKQQLDNQDILSIKLQVPLTQQTQKPITVQHKQSTLLNASFNYV